MLLFILFVYSAWAFLSFVYSIRVICKFPCIFNFPCIFCIFFHSFYLSVSLYLLVSVNLVAAIETRKTLLPFGAHCISCIFTLRNQFKFATFALQDEDPNRLYHFISSDEDSGPHHFMPFHLMTTPPFRIISPLVYV